MFVRMLWVKVAVRALCVSAVVVSQGACSPDSDATARGRNGNDLAENRGSSSGASAATAAGAGAANASGAGQRAPSGTGMLPPPGSAGSRPAGAGSGAILPPASTPSAGFVAPAGRGGSSGDPGAPSSLAGSGGVGGSPMTAAGRTGATGGRSSVAGGSSMSGGGTEPGRMAGITAAHNVVRARIMNPAPNPPLAPLMWSQEIANIAQTYAEQLAAGGDCLRLVHSQRAGLGENLAGYTGKMATPADVVEGWAAEEECTTYGPITRNGDECNMTCAKEKFSSGCGHYTQVVWRGTSEVGCGVATCGTGRSAGEIWVCNYRQPGNVIGQKPY